MSGGVLGVLNGSTDRSGRVVGKTLPARRGLGYRGRRGPGFVAQCPLTPRADGRGRLEALYDKGNLPARAVCTGIITIYRPAGTGRSRWQLGWARPTDPSGAWLAFVDPESAADRAGFARFPVQFTLPAGVTQIVLRRTGTPPGGLVGSHNAIYINSGATNTFLIATIA